jgi:hypothetical protein
LPACHASSHNHQFDHPNGELRMAIPCDIRVFHNNQSVHMPSWQIHWFWAKKL